MPKSNGNAAHGFSFKLIIALYDTIFKRWRCESNWIFPNRKESNDKRAALAVSEMLARRHERSGCCCCCDQSIAGQTSLHAARPRCSIVPHNATRPVPSSDDRLLVDDDINADLPRLCTAIGHCRRSDVSRRRVYRICQLSAGWARCPCGSVEGVTLMSRALSGTSPSVLRRYVNGGILDPSESEEATTGLLQASATADDEDDGLPTTTTSAVIQTSTAASGGRLEASGTEVSLHGRPAPPAPAPGGKTSSSTSIRSSWKLKYQDFLPERKHGRFAKWNPSSSEHFQWVSSVTIGAHVQFFYCYLFSGRLGDHESNDYT